MTERTGNALRILDRIIGADDELRAMIDEELVNAEVAHLIRDARVRAGLSQCELAGRIGTSQPTIARLERADYSGHSLSMLRRIATALSLKIEIRFLSVTDTSVD